jgi:hypothetical protein
LKNTDSPNSTDGSGSENENIGAGEDGMATISSQRRLVQVLRDSKKVMKAAMQIYKEKYEEATDDAKELWKFVYCDAIRSILSKQDKDDIYEKGVTKDKIMEKVTVSDEAMVMTIILVKIEETLSEEGNGQVSDLSANSTVKGQGKGGGRKKRKTVGEHGKKKKVPFNHREGSLDPELGKHSKLFLAVRSKIMRARSIQTTNDDGLGWYEAIAKEISRLKKGKLGNLIDGSPTRMPDLLEDLASGNNVGLDVDGEFSRCIFTEDVMEEEDRLARARGVYSI